MKQTIFFSWQADRPSRTGRSFIKEVLEEVCGGIASDSSVDEALRGMRVDSDTQGVAGQPPIVDTIFRKIDASSIFVGDATFVGKRIDKRPTPNPNVLIEYGWALKSKTHERVILLMNTAYGEPSEKDLPFNLRHVRWPMQYCLQENASAEDKAKEKSRLVKDLNKAIRACLETLPATPVELPAKFPEAEAKDGPARFRLRESSLGYRDGFGVQSELEVFLAEGPAIWFRLMPAIDPKKRYPIHELKKILLSNSADLLPLTFGSGGDFVLAEDGVGMYSARPQENKNSSVKSVKTDATAFVFETGEIWSIETSLLKYNSGKIFQTEIEERCVSALQRYGKFLQRLSLNAPYRWIAGIYGTKGRNLGYATKPGHHRFGDGPVCLSDLISAEGSYDGVQSATTAMLPFFNKIFEKCGVERPDHLPK